ncbi:uncharacterized protein TNCV_3758321 [Trichonephila clavipes]|nr:uncharacterized protein TNCV_3758321 [Trichonephila clavipes]
MIQWSAGQWIGMLLRTFSSQSRPLGYPLDREVPQKLTAEDKSKRKVACLALLRDQRKEKILNRIVTCDEKWVYYNNTSRKEDG